MHMSKAIQFEVEKWLEMSLSGGERNHASTFNVKTKNHTRKNERSKENKLGKIWFFFSKSTKEVSLLNVCF